MYSQSVPNPLAQIQDQSRTDFQSEDGSPSATLQGASVTLGQQVVQAAGASTNVKSKTAGQLKACMGDSAFHSRIARDPRVVAALHYHFSAYQAGSENKGIQFFQEELGSSTPPSAANTKAASLLVSDLCSESDPSLKANGVGLDELRTSLKLLVPQLGAHDVDCVLLHYALDLGAVVSSEGWITQTSDSFGFRDGVMAGPFVNAVHDDKLHLAQTLIERGCVNVNQPLPLRGMSNVGAKDSPSLLSIASLNGSSQMVELLLMHGADTNGQAHGLNTLPLNTPLAIAVRVKSPEVASLLLKHGADRNRPLILTRDVNLSDANIYPVKVNETAMLLSGSDVFEYQPQHKDDVGFVQFSSIDQFVKVYMEHSQDQEDLLKAFQKQQ